MRVLVIPEDSRKDKDLLKPIIEALMADVGKPKAKVRICEKPILGGDQEALKQERIEEIVDLWRINDLFLLLVDRDGRTERRRALDQIEEAIAKVLPPDKVFLAENAWQEAEVWVLAGHELPQDWKWRTIREERDPKERYFQPFLKMRGLEDNAVGRSTVAEEAARNFQRICDRCPELKGLAQRIRERLPSP